MFNSLKQSWNSGYSNGMLKARLDLLSDEEFCGLIYMLYTAAQADGIGGPFFDDARSANLGMTFLLKNYKKRTKRLLGMVPTLGQNYYEWAISDRDLSRFKRLERIRDEVVAAGSYGYM